MTMELTCDRYEREFEQVQDVFELQVRAIGDCYAAYRIGSARQQFYRHIKLIFNLRLQRNLNNSFAYDLVPSTTVVTAALRAARRVNDYPTAVRIFEGMATNPSWLSSIFIPSAKLPLALLLSTFGCVV